jgi:hypothetical protein
MEHFAWHDSSYIFGVDCNQPHRCPAPIHKFHFVSRSVFIDVNDRADIPTIEFLVLGIAIKDNKFVFGDHDEASG